MKFFNYKKINRQVYSLKIFAPHNPLTKKVILTERALIGNNKKGKTFLIKQIPNKISKEKVLYKFNQVTFLDGFIINYNELK